MCTTAAKKFNDSWFLIKTRDPVRWMRWDDEIKLFSSASDTYKKYIIQNPNPNEDGFYAGMNEKGVAFVSTFVRVDEIQISYIRKPYVRLILDAKNAKEAIRIIQSFFPRIGGNMFIADERECYGIERTPNEYYVETIQKPSVKTNHFLHLPYKNLGFKTNPSFKIWSHTHQKRAEELIQKARNLNDLKKILKDRKHADTKNAICTTAKEDPCYTYSACIFDTQQKIIYYCQDNPLTNPFKKYRFNS